MWDEVEVRGCLQSRRESRIHGLVVVRGGCDVVLVMCDLVGWRGLRDWAGRWVILEDGSMEYGGRGKRTVAGWT